MEKNNKKIFFLSVFNPFRGGIAQFSDSFVKSFEAIKKIEIINFKTQYPSFLFPGKTQYVEGKSKIDNPSFLSSINIVTWIRLAKKLKKEKGIFIYSYWHTFFAPMLLFILKRIKNKQRIALVHNLIPHEPKWFDRFFVKRILKNTDKFVVLSKEIEAQIKSLNPNATIACLFHPLYNHFGEKMKVFDARNKLGINDNKKVLLFFGLIRPYKGLDVLLKSISDLDDIHLLIVGEAYESFDKYQKIINDFNLKDRIFVNSSYVPDSEVSLFFSAADALVLPYKSATQSGVTAIAYHFDLPVIATNVGALPDDVEHLKTGIICEANDEFSLKSGIELFYKQNNEELLKNIRIKKKELSWENFAKNLADFIQL